MSYTEVVHQVHTGFARKGHAGAQGCVNVALVQIRTLVRLDSDSMTDAMRKGIAVASILDNTTGSDVNVRRCVAQSQR
jgi:hypothetical protein